MRLSAEEYKPVSEEAATQPISLPAVVIDECKLTAKYHDRLADV